MLPLVHERCGYTINNKITRTTTLKSPFSPICFKKKEIVAMSENEQTRIDLLLSHEQKALVQLMHAGHNIYFTGIVTL